MPFEYAVIRVVPRIERGEFVNAGVLLYCRERDYLGVAIELDDARLLAVDPTVDVAAVHDALEALTETCDGHGGPAAAEQIGRRFRWLTAPRSTVVQTGPVHTGLTDDPSTTLAALLQSRVRPPA